MKRHRNVTTALVGCTPPTVVRRQARYEVRQLHPTDYCLKSACSANLVPQGCVTLQDAVFRRQAGGLLRRIRSNGILDLHL